jgi:caa(3)-type oxidase subunit IV
MAEAHAAHSAHASHSHGQAAHAHPNYVKIWAILLGLLVVSVVGPMFGNWVVTLITAFGIAVVKAYLVVVNFMHVNVEKRYIAYLLTTCLVFMLLFFAGAAPDVMKDQGAIMEDGSAQWVKPNYHVEIPAEGPGEEHGGGGH